MPQATLEKVTKKSEGTKLVVSSAVHRMTKLRVSQEFIDELNGDVETLIADAEWRAKENGRQTLQKQDL